MMKCTDLTSKTLPALSVSIAVFAAGAAFAADKDTYDRGIRTKVVAPPSITFLPREVSKSLKISRVPTSEPIPLIVGTYFSCETNSQGFEICDTLVVACNDDQTFCTQIP